MEYQDRVNRPLGMSDLDLLVYDKDIYTMYRTHEGLETDAFRYDPVVSAGMLASDYAFAQGMQWVNLLTPASQDKINPGDGLIVPVQTYDNYKNLPPIEKYLTHEVSYTANQLNIVRDQSLHNEFVGDFNNYFDAAGRVASPSLFPVAPVKPIRFPVRPSATPISLQENVIVAPIKGPVKQPISAPITQIPHTIQPTSFIQTPHTIQPTINQPISNQQITEVPHTVQPTNNNQNEVVFGGFIGGGGSSMGSGGGAMQSGGDAGVMLSSAEQAPEVQGESSAPVETKTEVKNVAKVSAKFDYMPIVFGVIIFALIGYFYAKNKNKNIKMFTIIGAIVGGTIGYLYSTKTSKSESKYFVDDFYR
jgi:hypothetical protein